MALFNKKGGGGFMDVIRCDETDYLIWKWRPQDADGSDRRANSIRWGSSLRVKDGEVAVFVYPQENGVSQDYLEGPYDGIIETKNLPVLTGILGLAYNGESPFQAEVYFINLAGMIQVRFGVPYFNVFDPRYMDYGVPTAVRGSFHFRIADYRAFIKLHKLSQFDLNTFEDQVKDAVIKHVKSVVMNAPDKFGIPVVQIERQITEISSLVEAELRESLYDNFGVALARLDVSAIEPDKESEGYKKLSSLTQNKGVSLVHKVASVKDSIGLHGVGAKNIKNTVKGNNLKKDISGALGGIGSKLSGAVGGVFGGKKQSGTAPPPLPSAAYYVAVEDEQTGPYSMSELRRMAGDGSLTRDSLVWKEGMEEWIPAGEMENLVKLFGSD